MLFRSCTCLPGYEPKSPKNWYHRDGSEGCVRKQLGLSMCGNGEGFVKVEHLKGPDSFNAVWMDMSLSSSECEQACLRNCSCTAFVSVNIDGNGTNCLAWYGELIDISENSFQRWDLNVRVDATELGGLLHLLAFFVNFHYCLFHLTNCGLIFFFWSFSYLHKEVQRFSWPQQAAGYYNNFCHGDIVSGMLDGLYMPNEEEENKR